jgi:hypothetical protein
LKPADQTKDKKLKEKEKQEPETKKISKPTTDLDSLLEEEGLREKTPIKKKKLKSQPKRVDSKDLQTLDLTREKLKKMNIDKLRIYCKDRKIKISSKDTKSQIIRKILDSKNKKK